jgi:hypothetical protein
VAILLAKITGGLLVYLLIACLVGQRLRVIRRRLPTLNEDEDTETVGWLLKLPRAGWAWCRDVAVSLRGRLAGERSAWRTKAGLSYLNTASGKGA